jgi:serine/threonine-protein kinase
LVTLTPQEQLITVPDVVDMPMVQARRAIERAGFRFVLREERDEPGAGRGVVLEQDPPAGESAPQGAEIAVVVNRMPRKLTMPAVVGYPVEQVQNGLESNGLQVNVDEVWSTQPEGMVLTQEPERGTSLLAGDAVTLTVSAGVDEPIQLEVNLADLIVLESAELRQQAFRPGDVIAVTLRWQAMRPISTPYVVFVHLINAETPGEQSLVAQQDIQPMTPTTGWVAGDTVADPHQVTIPSDLPAGRYELRTGMYPQGEPSSRLQVVDPGLATVESGSILITEIEIQP